VDGEAELRETCIKAVSHFRRRGLKRGIYRKKKRRGGKRERLQLLAASPVMSTSSESTGKKDG